MAIRVPFSRERWLGAGHDALRRRHRALVRREHARRARLHGEQRIVRQHQGHRAAGRALGNAEVSQRAVDLRGQRGGRRRPCSTIGTRARASFRSQSSRDSSRARICKRSTRRFGRISVQHAAHDRSTLALGPKRRRGRGTRPPRQPVSQSASSTSRFEVPLSEELELVREYLAIEEVRFRDRLHTDVCAAERSARVSRASAHSPTARRERRPPRHFRRVDGGHCRSDARRCLPGTCDSPCATTDPA